MKYILMMQFPVIDWKTSNLGTWPPEDVKRNIDFLHRFNTDLRNSGELVSVEALVGPEEIKIIRAKKDGTPAITDGPFPESKEFLAGYWIVDVDSPERAYEIAASASAMPGKGGVPANIPIEVRAVMNVPNGDL
ncbi:hypothetical protein LEP1GSC050_0195 [Leptospira broomii serovar Hurstbridge str. 5399]|uniref:YCII-related domain-containing protein n=1 Tax=Leptospira broomii serovar Hurstbridge str. 5399 TaxID=1049789 RepID=T0FF59_9LEPT|nr:YciI family protein [Leptospira broomii]EQA46242.1 hypothetical protein LEP1GSC050_0195 [Leptospira broomii serovar Hurstbridge str. 5399]